MTSITKILCSWLVDNRECWLFICCRDRGSGSQHVTQMAWVAEVKWIEVKKLEVGARKAPRLLVSHISCSWEAGWPSGCPKVAGVPIAGQEEYGEGAPSGKNCFFANFHVIWFLTAFSFPFCLFFLSPSFWRKNPALSTATRDSIY